MTGNGGYHDWAQQGPPPGPPPGPAYDWAAQDPRSSGGGPGPGLVIALAVGAVVLLVAAFLVVVLIQFRGSGDGGPVAGGEMVTVTSTAPAGAATSGASTSASTTSTSKTTTTTRTRAPEPGGLVEECSDSGGSELPRAGRGTEATSCPFANSVRDAYFDTARPGDPALVEAYSPVTGQRYDMRCTGGEVITCRGGNNAVVYLY